MEENDTPIKQTVDEAKKWKSNIPRKSPRSQNTQNEPHPGTSATTDACNTQVGQKNVEEVVPKKDNEENKKKTENPPKKGKRGRPSKATTKK